MSCFLLVVRKLDLVLSRLFVVNITGVATFELAKLSYEDVITPLRDMIYGSANLDLFRVQRVLLVKPYLV